MSMSVPSIRTDQPQIPVRPEPSALSSSPPKPASTQGAPEAQARVAAMEQAKSTRAQLKEALTEMNQQMQRNGRNLAFSVDEKSNRTVIKVSNATTGEVVRQIPEEVVLRIAHSLDELKGVLYDEKT